MKIEACIEGIRTGIHAAPAAVCLLRAGATARAQRVISGTENTKSDPPLVKVSGMPSFSRAAK